MRRKKTDKTTVKKDAESLRRAACAYSHFSFSLNSAASHCESVRAVPEAFPKTALNP